MLKLARKLKAFLTPILKERCLPVRVRGRWMIFTKTEDWEWDGKSWSVVGKYCAKCGAPIYATEVICEGCKWMENLMELERALLDGYNGHLNSAGGFCLWRVCPHCGGIAEDLTTCAIHQNLVQVYGKCRCKEKEAKEHIPPVT